MNMELSKKLVTAGKQSFNPAFIQVFSSYLVVYKSVIGSLMYVEYKWVKC